MPKISRTDHRMGRSYRYANRNKNKFFSAVIPGQLTIKCSVPIEILKEALVFGLRHSVITDVQSQYSDSYFSNSVGGIRKVDSSIAEYRENQKHTPLAEIGGGLHTLYLAKDILNSHLVVSSSLSVAKYAHKGYNRARIFVTLQDRSIVKFNDTLARLGYHQRRIFRYLFSRTYDWGSVYSCLSQEPGDDFLLVKLTKGRPDTEISNPRVECRLNPPEFIARET